MQASVLQRTSATTALAIGVLTLSVLLLAAPAQAQPSIGEATKQVTDTVETTTGTVGKTVTDTGAKVGDTVTDTGAKVGDSVGGDTGAAVKDSSGKVGSAVKDTSAAVGSTIDETTKELTDGAEEVARVIDKTLDDAGVDLDDKGTVSGTKGTTGSNHTAGNFPRVPDRLEEPAVAPFLLTSARGSGASAVAPTVSDGSAVADAVRRALEALEKIAFPLALTLLVLAYLGAQGWFDRRDPKLALAAVDPDAHLLRFE